ncbi:MAG: ABC transporter substrate-binding protein [Lachnospiraceae bacterium]|nr:ABC transporter substrate-binding protein [Lachnospiraceae bacterium]
MKKAGRIVSIVLILAVCFAFTACSQQKKLKLFIPGEYMSDNFVSDFEKEFGVKVIVEYFDSNEMMYTKLAAGDSYDVLVPSDYMIERLLKEKLLQKIDRTKITNFSNLSDQVLGLDYDPANEYSIPYFWGTVGIVYNHDHVDKADLEAKGYDILKDTRYSGKIYMYDSERDSFMLAFKQLGYSCNTDNEDEINAAYEWLVELNKTMAPIYVTDDVIDGMINGTKDMAIVYSGDAVTILSENEDMSYFTPDCGTNVWCDAFVIPANAENADLAHEFINYAIRYQVCKDNTLAVGYASPNAQVLEEMTAEDGEYADNEAYLPRNNPKDEIFHDNENLRKKLSELWIKVKAAN